MHATDPTSRQNRESAPLSPWQLFRRRLWRQRIGMVGSVILVVFYLITLLAGWVAPYGYQRQDRERFFHPPTGLRIRDWRVVVPRYQQMEGQFVYRPVLSDTKPLRFFVR